MGRFVEIGSRRERVEVLDEPLPPIVRQNERLSPGRIGRIKHANGENACIDYETLKALMRRAAQTRQEAGGKPGR